MILPFFFSCKRWSFGVIPRMYYDLWIPARFTLSYLLALVLHPGGKNYSAATAQFFTVLCCNLGFVTCHVRRTICRT